MEGPENGVCLERNEGVTIGYFGSWRQLRVRSNNPSGKRSMNNVIVTASPGNGETSNTTRFCTGAEIMFGVIFHSSSVGLKFRDFRSAMIDESQDYERKYTLRVPQKKLIDSLSYSTVPSDSRLPL